MGASQRRRRGGVNVQRPQRSSAGTNDVGACKARRSLNWPGEPGGWGRCRGGGQPSRKRICAARRTLHDWGSRICLRQPMWWTAKWPPTAIVTWSASWRVTPRTSRRRVQQDQDRPLCLPPHLRPATRPPAPRTPLSAPRRGPGPGGPSIGRLGSLLAIGAKRGEEGSFTFKRGDTTILTHHGRRPGSDITKRARPGNRPRRSDSQAINTRPPPAPARNSHDDTSRRHSRPRHRRLGLRRRWGRPGATDRRYWRQWQPARMQSWVRSRPVSRFRAPT